MAEYEVASVTLGGEAWIASDADGRTLATRAKGETCRVCAAVTAWRTLDGEAPQALVAAIAQWWRDATAEVTGPHTPDWLSTISMYGAVPGRVVSTEPELWVEIMPGALPLYPKGCIVEAKLGRHAMPVVGERVPVTVRLGRGGVVLSAELES